MSDLKPITLKDFSGGENTVTNPFLLKENQSQQILNMLMDEHGSLHTRSGTERQGVAAPRPDRPIVKIYDLNQIDGTSRPLAIQLGTFGPNTLWIRNANPWKSIGDFTSTYATPDIVTFTNLGIIAGGNTEPLKSTDGTVATGLVALTAGGGSLPPGAAHIAVHLGFLWVGNTSPTSSSTAGPSSLQMSDLNNPNSWPGANQTFIAKDDGQSIQALTQYTIAESGISPTATLIVWKDFSGYECSGVLGTTGFSVQKIKSDMGCIAPRSCQFASGFGVIRLTHRGFALYDGVNDTLISEEERPRIFGHGQYTGLDWANINKSMASQCANPPLYICACPIVGGNGSLQRVFIYDLVRRSWSICTFTYDIATMQLILDPNQLPAVMFGDYSAGYVRKAFANAVSDDGFPITWSLVTREVGTTNYDRAYWRRMLAKFALIAEGTVITTTFTYGPNAPVNSKVWSATVPTITSTTGFLGWGLDEWGPGLYGSEIAGIAGTASDFWSTELWSASPWSGTDTLTLTETSLEFPIGVVANSVTMTISGTGPMTFRGCELHVRQKSLTRSTVVTA